MKEEINEKKETKQVGMIQKREAIGKQERMDRCRGGSRR